MPYVVLVSALGAIVAATIAMFSLHSWTAFIAAPIPGALLALLFAILSLRRYELPLHSTLDTYRSAAGISEVPQLYLQSALGIALVVSCIELPTIAFGQDAALAICLAGTAIVLGGTIYRCWRQTNPPIKLDIFQIVGGIGGVAMFGFPLYGLATTISGRTLDQTIPWIDLVKMIFILNCMVAFLSTIIACFAFAIVSGLNAGTDDLGR